MGEVGIDRREYLYELTHLELILISRGYSRRSRNLWSAARWHAYNIMNAIPYCDMRKAGINSPTDLISFPWDKENDAPPLSEQEVAQMQEEMRLFNEQAHNT